MKFFVLLFFFFSLFFCEIVFARDKNPDSRVRSFSEYVQKHEGNIPRKSNLVPETWKKQQKSLYLFHPSYEKSMLQRWFGKKKSSLDISPKGKKVPEKKTKTTCVSTKKLGDGQPFGKCVPTTTTEEK